MAVNIDELNFQIIRHLRDGRKSYSEIARDLRVSENTVRTRVKNLLDTDVLDVAGLVDPYAIPNHMVIMAGFKLGTPDLVGVAEKFKALRGVTSVVVVTGQYDLIATVLLNDKYTIKHFYTEEVPKIQGVRSFETWVVYHNVNLRVPYTL